MRLNKAKRKIGLTEVAYVGHVFGPDGLKPSEDKICAVLKFQSPGIRKNYQGSWEQ